MKRTVLIITIALATILVYHGCEKKVGEPPDVSPTAGNAVSIQNYTFSPVTITVPINTSVIWTNKDGFAHTVTSNTNIFSSGNINGGDTFSYRFTTAGSYPYKCTIHAFMTGRVIVK